MPIDSDDIDAIAARLAELVPGPTDRGAPKGLATAAEVAARLGVGRDWVYANQERLGVIRLGDGPKARLRFDLDRAAQALSDRGEARVVRRSRRRGGGSGLPPGVKLIKGRGRGDRTPD